ncbi:MAG: flagellin [Bryobacteraceae bacterium]|nr:flagellin [Bryobacteraceae bacterium]MDW8379069.1 flagellin [Bryobacterales bacterium]
MSFRINTNVPSLVAQENLRQTSLFQQKTIERVTSGLRITSSGDDAAGLAIANGFRSDIAVLTQGIRNANDGLSTLQIIDGGINNISKLLDRARTLATQSASSTFTGSRSVLNAEFQSVLTEINRQAQTIGLDRGGQFAKALSVFIGGGKANGGITEITNGSVGVDLTSSTVDTQSLGLSGVQAASRIGTDLSASSTTSVQAIVNDTTNRNSTAVAGYTDFYFRGAGFSDADRIKVSVNLSGITNTSTLVEAVNSAIAAAGNGSTSAATAFKNANIRAVVVTDKQADGTVKERLGFVSSTGAFQVKAGDRLSNALLGNFVNGATGKDLSTVFVGAGVVTGTSTGSGAANVIVRVQGSGLASPVDITLNITQGTTTAIQLANSLKTAIDNNATLQAAGISLDTPVAGESLVFRSRAGDRFEVLIAGDNDNLLGLGSFRLATDTATSFDYTSVTGGAVSLSTTSAQTFEFSIGGGPVQQVVVNGLTAGTVTAAVAAINAGIAANSTLSAAGLQASVQSGVIQIASTNGTAFRMNALAPTQDNFGFGTNATTGTGTAFSANYADAIYSTTDGPYAITASSNDVFSFSVNGGPTTNITLTAGPSRTATQIAADLNGNATFAAAATAYVVNGSILITADSPNTKITLVDSSALSTLGFSVGQSNYADKATVNSGGAYATELGTKKEVFSFNPLRDGSQDQTITLSAVDSQGSERSIAITLRNDATNRNARSIDEAIKTINSQLQQSADPTLKQLVAVKEQTSDGKEEGIRFLSTLKDFRVSIGVSSGSTAANEVGIYDGTSGTGVLGQGLVTKATQSDGGSQLDISNIEGATAAVTALANAVARLGDAQAVVGRGQNQFNYAINLAQSQVTNIAAAESRIRDADLAQEAANLTKAQIVLQAGIAAAAQANSAPQQVLALLRG